MRSEPWLPAPAIPLLHQLSVRKYVLEFGSGGSTIWFGNIAKWIVSVEHNREWYEKVVQFAPGNADVVFEAPDASPKKGFLAYDGVSYSEYIRAGVTAAIRTLRQIDLVLVDGRARSACVYACVSLVEPGGWIVLDDAQRQRYDVARRALINRDWRLVHDVGDAQRRTQFWQRPFSI